MTAADLIAAYLARRDPAAEGVQLLAVAACPAAFVDVQLLRRLRVVALRGHRLPVDAEMDLWWSPLVKNVSVSGAALDEAALPALYERFAAWTMGSAREVAAAERAAEVIAAYPSNPLRRIQERITLAALRPDDPHAEIANALAPVLEAVSDGRRGVAQWAGRSLSRLPTRAKQTTDVWQVAVTARSLLGPSTDIDLGAVAPDTSTVPGAIDLPLVELALRRRGDVLELGAIRAERTPGILVPDTIPRVIEVASSPNDAGERVAIRSGELVQRSIGTEAIYLRTLSGTVYKVEPPRATEPAPKVPIYASARGSTAGDLIIVVPGMYGSILQRDGRDLWNIRPRTMLRMLQSRLFNELTLRLDDSPDVDDLDGVRPTRLLGDLTVIPGLWRTDGYDRLVQLLERKTLPKAGGTLIGFPWDWRRDIRVAAKRLARVVDEHLDRMRAEGNPDARVVLIGHGIGGLVAAWYTDVLGGSDLARLLITIGTPFRGSVSVLDQLVNGSKVGLSLFSADQTEMIRSFTTTYQMLPTYSCVEVSGSLHPLKSIDLPNLDRRRVVDAMSVHNTLEAAGTEVDPRGRRLIAVAGIDHPTPNSARLLDNRLVLDAQSVLPDGRSNGDGIVPVIAAYPAFLDASQVTYVAARQGQLHVNEQVLTQLDALIRFNESSTLRVARSATVSVEIVDQADARLPIEVRLSGDSPFPLQISLEDADGRRIANVSIGQLLPDRPITTEFAPTDPGVYRVEVRDPTGAVVASDIAAIGFGESSWDAED